MSDLFECQWASTHNVALLSLADVANTTVLISHDADDVNNIWVAEHSLSYAIQRNLSCMNAYMRGTASERVATKITHMKWTLFIPNYQ